MSFRAVCQGRYKEGQTREGKGQEITEGIKIPSSVASYDPAIGGRGHNYTALPTGRFFANSELSAVMAYQNAKSLDVSYFNSDIVFNSFFEPFSDTTLKDPPNLATRGDR